MTDEDYPPDPEPIDPETQGVRMKRDAEEITRGRGGYRGKPRAESGPAYKQSSVPSDSMRAPIEYGNWQNGHSDLATFLEPIIADDMDDPRLVKRCQEMEALRTMSNAERDAYYNKKKAEWQARQARGRPK